jgi:hypothetical protein
MSTPVEPMSAPLGMSSEWGGSALQTVVDLLDAIHRPKDQAYRDAWRKRGELLSIFANLARKVDRLEIAMEEHEPSKVESIEDSAADLAIYAGKYLTWLAELHPAEFGSIPPLLPADECSAVRGPDGLRAVLRRLPLWERDSGHHPPATAEESWLRIRSAFQALEAGFLAQVGNHLTEVLDPSRKIALAWDLTDAGTWLVVRLGEVNPGALERLRTNLTGGPT